MTQLRKDKTLCHVVDKRPMQCPQCQAGKTKVIDSRDHGGARYRVRECRGCGARYSTCETVMAVSAFEAIVIGGGNDKMD